MPNTPQSAKRKREMERSASGAHPHPHQQRRIIPNDLLVVIDESPETVRQNEVHKHLITAVMRLQQQLPVQQRPYGLYRKPEIVESIRRLKEKRAAATAAALAANPALEEHQPATTTPPTATLHATTTAATATLHTATATATTTNMEPTPQEILSEIYHFKLLLEDARIMDQARLQSEQQKEAELDERRRSHRSRLQTATFEDYKTKHFPHSLILQNCAATFLEPIAEQIQQHLLPLLVEEDRARKWFPNLAPAYFETVCQTMLQTPTGDTNSLVEYIQTEVKRVREAMYSLSAQEKGVPILFQNAYKQKGGDGVITVSDDTDG